MRRSDKDLYFNNIETVPSHIEARQELERQENRGTSGSITNNTQRVDSRVGDSVGESTGDN